MAGFAISVKRESLDVGEENSVGRGGFVGVVACGYGGGEEKEEREEERGRWRNHYVAFGQ